MLRSLNLSAAILIATSFCAAANAQEASPSLGDVARQVRKDKSKMQPKTVITNEDMPSGATMGASGFGQISDSKNLSGPGFVSASAALERFESVINKLDTMDRATLVKLSLQDKDVDFPNRSGWETRLYSAKQIYVARGRELLQEMKQVLASAQALDQQGNVKGDDPRVQALFSRIKDITKEAVQTDAAFQAVIIEGRNRATESAGH